jgi:phosphatidylserine/phosphatidylglycerophosphate/cardiolipin synthase-like enzyme
MTRLLERAIVKVRELPEEDQEAVAAVMLSMAGVESRIVRLDDATRESVREGVEQAERGEFISDEVIAQSDKRHGINLAEAEIESPLHQELTAASSPRGAP